MLIDECCLFAVGGGWMNLHRFGTMVITFKAGTNTVTHVLMAFVRWAWLEHTSGLKHALGLRRGLIYICTDTPNFSSIALAFFG
jgi:hypothetical protein